MPEQITIPISTFEVLIKYQKPVVRLVGDRVDLLQQLFDAFDEFQPNADDLEIITTGKTSALGVKLKIASQRATIFFGVAHCIFTKEAAVWDEADHILGMLETFLRILVGTSGVVLGTTTTFLSLHIQPKTARFQDILRPFIVPQIQDRDSSPMKSMAVVARWNTQCVTLDGSAQLANGIFVQLERQFDADVSFADIKTIVFEDELSLFSMLDIVEVQE